MVCMVSVAIHKDSGKRHIANGEYGNPICGEKPLKMNWDTDEWLDDFPEDFGDIPSDCEKCAKKFNQ